jgi:hypothetical protein
VVEAGPSVPSNARDDGEEQHDQDGLDEVEGGAQRGRQGQAQAGQAGEGGKRGERGGNDHPAGQDLVGADQLVLAEVVKAGKGGTDR